MNMKPAEKLNQQITALTGVINDLEGRLAAIECGAVTTSDVDRLRSEVADELEVLVFTTRRRADRFVTQLRELRATRQGASASPGVPTA